LWKGCEEEEIKMAIRQVERNVMVAMHDCMFSVVQEDHVLKQKQQVYCSLDDFHLPAKYHSEAPWPFAQAELQKMTTYEAPHDKFLCISRCWEIISNCVSLLDDPGPDACFPIMAYVIYSSGIENVWSHIHYITLFAKLEDIEDARLLAFRTVTKILKQILDKVGEQKPPNIKRASFILGQNKFFGKLLGLSSPN